MKASALLLPIPSLRLSLACLVNFFYVLCVTCNSCALGSWERPLLLATVTFLFVWAVPASWAARCIPDVWQLFRPFFVAAAGRTDSCLGQRTSYAIPIAIPVLSAALLFSPPAYTCVAVFLLPAPTGFLGLRRRLHRVLEFLGCIIECSAFSFASSIPFLSFVPLC